MQKLSIGSMKRYGLPEPAHKLFDKHPTVASELLDELRLGKVTPRPAVDRIDGSTVHFSDGTSGEFDTIISATGYTIAFPFIDRELLSWHGGVPLMILAQEHLDRPLVDYLSRLRKPHGRMLVGVRELMREVRLGRHAVRLLIRLRGRPQPRRDLRERPPATRARSHRGLHVNGKVVLVTGRARARAGRRGRDGSRRRRPPDAAPTAARQRSASLMRLSRAPMKRPG